MSQEERGGVIEGQSESVAGWLGSLAEGREPHRDTRIYTKGQKDEVTESDA